MKILALESSAVAASVALCEDETLIAQAFQNTGLTHSQTLLPLTEDLLKNCGLTMADVDLIAVAEGPGSFTGLRIGVAAAKGLAWGGELPCAGCSTLESMAWNLAGFEGEVCAAMDARRKQVYNARFRVDGTQVHRLTEDRAISLEDLGKELSALPGPVFLVGDGSYVAHKALPCTVLPQEHRLHQRAAGVALAAEEKIRRGESCDGAALAPNYLRLSQAERERLEKQKK